MGSVEGDDDCVIENVAGVPGDIINLLNKVRILFPRVTSLSACLIITFFPPLGATTATPGSPLMMDLSKILSYYFH